MEKNITFDYQRAEEFIISHELEYLEPYLLQAQEILHRLEGPGREYAGWVDWPLKYNREEFERIKAAGGRIRERAEVLVVIGIGGSYLGARAALELLNHTFYNRLSQEEREGPEIYFAGFNMSPIYLEHLLEVIGEKDIWVNVVSKSGTTLEPALAFRVFRDLIEKRRGKEGARERIIATTDKSRGALKKLAEEEGYETFTVPDEVGGRYSLLTPVGLLPIAAGGIDLDKLMAGAEKAYHLCSRKSLAENPSCQYAAIRNLLYRKGKIIELLVSYEPSFYYLTEWWKQLFGESEGKDKKGIFPAGMNFTTDLHSLGQYIQDGYRNLFATTLQVEKPPVDREIFKLQEDMDGLNYLAGKTFHQVNQKAWEGTVMAHTEGEVPNLTLTLPEITPYYFGQLVYFFEKACGLSGYLLGVNPFDQPGVEAYKKKMFQLLGKPEA